MTSNKQSTSTRRKFLGGAAVATAAAVTAPSVVKAQGPISMQGAGQCTPERIKADEEMLASIVQVTEWRREGDAILLIGPTTMKFRPATN